MSVIQTSHMKKLAYWAIPFLTVLGSSFILMQACTKTSNTPKTKTFTYTYTMQTPVYQLKQNVMDSINGNAAEVIDSLGKIYVKDNLIFLNDVDKGIHIIDNTNPAHPAQIAFLKIPGNQDIVIKGNMLYADMYSDLLAIDISDLHHAQISTMLPAIFTDRGYANGYFMDSNQVIVSWIKKDTTITVTEPIYSGGINPGGLPVFFAASASTNASSQSNTGVAGSTAKMTLINNYIYAITEMHTLGTIDLSNPKLPAVVSSFFAGYDLETIFPFKDKLFLGSDIGTFIYDISNPANPVQVGKFEHGQACDPVITDGTNAYITLHAGTYCGGASNELDVVDVQNLTQPFLVRTYPMTSPTGLCKDGNLLFVCDGTNEVKVFDASNAASISQLSILTVKGPNDLIASNKNLMIVTNAGLYQFDYSNARSIVQTSFIAVK